VADRRRILLIDDDRTERETLVGVARALGAELVAAETGADGIRLAESERFDVLLVNVSMADVSGYEICRRLKANPETAPIPVFFVTEENHQDDILPGFEPLISGLLVKPLEARDLRIRFQNAIRQKNLLQELQTQVRFSERCLQLLRIFDEAGSPEDVRESVRRTLESIAGGYGAEGISFSLVGEGDLFCVGSCKGPVAAEIPVSASGVDGILRVFRARPLDMDETSRMAGLGGMIARGIKSLGRPEWLRSPAII